MYELLFEHFERWMNFVLCRETTGLCPAEVQAAPHLAPEGADRVFVGAWSSMGYFHVTNIGTLGIIRWQYRKGTNSRFKLWKRLIYHYKPSPQGNLADY